MSPKLKLPRHEIWLRRFSWWFVAAASVLLSFTVLKSCVVPDYPAAEGSRTGIRYELRWSGCDDDPEIWVTSPSGGPNSKKLALVDHPTTFVNCVHGPTRLFLSHDETTLFIRKRADQEGRPLNFLSSSGAYWSDLIDVSSNPPRLIWGGGYCCIEAEETLSRIHSEIDAVARQKQLVIPPYSN